MFVRNLGRPFKLGQILEYLILAIILASKCNCGKQSLEYSKLSGYQSFYKQH